MRLLLMRAPPCAMSHLVRSPVLKCLNLCALRCGLGHVWNLDLGNQTVEIAGMSCEEPWIFHGFQPAMGLFDWMRICDFSQVPQELHM